MKTLTRKKRGWALAMIAAGALILTGCTTDAPASSDASGGATDVSEDVLAELATGTQKTPDVSPIELKEGANVWIITCSLLAEGCATITKGAEEAAEVAGWNATVFDGQVNPTTYAEGIRAAISAGADGIILAAIDCAPVKASLEQARDAGIPTVTNFALDCDDPSVGGEALFTSTILDWNDFLFQWSSERARYLSELIGGEGEVIALVEPDFAAGVIVNDGFEAGMKEHCPDCTIAQSVDILGPELGNSAAAEKIASAVLANPEAKAIFSPFDAVTAGMPQALTQFQDRDLVIVGGEGLPSSIDLIRSGTVNGTLGLDSMWMGWASVDTLARVMNGEEVPDQGLGWQLVDKDTNLGDSGPYESSVDYRSAYKDAWGK